MGKGFVRRLAARPQFFFLERFFLELPLRQSILLTQNHGIGHVVRSGGRCLSVGGSVFPFFLPYFRIKWDFEGISRRVLSHFKQGQKIMQILTEKFARPLDYSENF